MSRKGREETEIVLDALDDDAVREKLRAMR